MLLIMNPFIETMLILIEIRDNEGSGSKKIK